VTAAALLGVALLVLGALALQLLIALVRGALVVGLLASPYLLYLELGPPGIMIGLPLAFTGGAILCCWILRAGRG